jgi:hypothetical protein
MLIARIYTTDPENLRGPRRFSEYAEPTKPPLLSPARGPPQAEIEFLEKETTWV